jgi:signal transduction histidine kinase
MKKVLWSANGQIWAESEPGIGSTFLFSLPVPGKD